MSLRDKVFFSALLCGAVRLSAQEEVVHVGGPVRHNEARPPLYRRMLPANTTSSAPPYTPQQVRHAYGFDQVTATGAGQTIAIVNAYGSPTAQKDLNQFCTQFHLPATTLVVASLGSQTNVGWAQETSLDVQWAHVIAPAAKILLVQAKSSLTSDLLAGVDYAVANGANVVSMSWGSGEFSGETTWDAHFNLRGVTFVASSGDSGEGIEWPAASPYVLGVGGTSLKLTTAGNYASETAWSGSGGGISGLESLPAFQSGWRNAANTAGGWVSTRGVPDVSFLADPATGVYVVYNGGWYAFGGTSVGAPQWAGLIALSNSARTDGKTLGSVTFPVPAAVYAAARGASVTAGGFTYFTDKSADFFDILAGSNGTNPDDAASNGYDLVTGLGSPNAAGLVKALTAY